MYGIYSFLSHGAEKSLSFYSPCSDQLKANPYTPSASPCGLGPVSDFDCIVSSRCCSYPVEGESLPHRSCQHMSYKRTGNKENERNDVWAVVLQADAQATELELNNGLWSLLLCEIFFSLLCVNRLHHGTAFDLCNAWLCGGAHSCPSSSSLWGQWCVLHTAEADLWPRHLHCPSGWLWSQQACKAHSICMYTRYCSARWEADRCDDALSAIQF